MNLESKKRGRAFYASLKSKELYKSKSHSPSK